MYLLAPLLTLTLTISASQSLWYNQPAAKWEEALPIGSGRLGAMVFGGTKEERIQFNEDTLWLGKPHNYVRAGSAEIVPQVQQLLAAGETKAAQDLARANMLSDPVRQMPYQPFGDLRLTFPGHDSVAAYRRELNLDTAVALTRYEVNGITYSREVIASYPDNVIAVRLTASRPGALTFNLHMDSPHKSSSTVAQVNQLILRGQVQADGLRFVSRVSARSVGGTVRADGDSLVVEKADSAMLLLVAATSFKSWEDISADPNERCTNALEKLAGRDFVSLLATHTADHQRLFRRVRLELHGPIQTNSFARHTLGEIPTDERLKLSRVAGSIDNDPELAVLEFNYGRYLMIASSRPGTQPANLQGVWNELTNPPWESKYTTNINFEMNYWLAELTGLGECHEPFFTAVEELRVSGARTAQQLYRSRGWVLHHNFDLWRGTAPINNIDGLWPTGGAWLCHHLWEHWLFTRDQDFLAKRAYPAMKEASLFFVDFLVADPKTGWLLTSPSHSPEQGGTTTGPTMDNQLIRFLWTATTDAARELNTDAELVADLERRLRILPPNLIGQHGQLQEWIEDVDVPDNKHRHMSPLWALYPGADITPADPKIFDAAKLLLKWRGDGSTGWSYAWRAPLWARVGDGEMAYRQLSQLLTRRTLPNLFDLCGPFQIDGNFGFTAGVVEMLLQSHQRSFVAPSSKANASSTYNARTNTPESIVIIELLPALPKTWPSGSVTGLGARDGFEVDLSWSEGQLSHVEVRSKLGRSFEIRCGGRSLKSDSIAGQSIALDAYLNPIP